MTNGVDIENKALKYLYKNFGEKFYNDDYITTTGIMIELGNNFYVTMRFRIFDKSIRIFL